MLFKRLFHLLPRLSSILKKAGLFAFFIECMKLIPPYLMKVAVDLLISSERSLLQVFSAIGGVLVISLLTTIVEDKYFLFSALNIFEVETTILRKGHEKLLSLGLRYHESHPSGDLVHLMNRGAARLSELLWFIQDQFLGAFFQIILTSILLVYVQPGCGMVFVFFMPLVIYLVHRTGNKVQPYRRRYHSKFREASWKMNQSLLNVRTVKDYVQEGNEHQRYNSLLNEYLRLAEERVNIENADNQFRDILLGIARFAVLFYAVYLVFHGQMTTGTLVLFATLSEKVIASLFRLGRLYNHLGDAIESISQFSELFEESADIVDTPDSIACPALNGEIVFEKTSFEYQDKIPVLHSIDLLIPARSVIAFVGRSGSGKSTMVKLISRHYDVSEGAIKVDGIDIRKIRVEEYRRRVAVVSQDIEIFDKTVSENIAYGVNASQSEIELAARAAYAHDFICALPEGYNTRVGEKGVKLSGGQRQRIGIARALLMKPTILIFDEATSSLDTESEQLIQSALVDISRRQTMIIIAHRLSTIKNADLIVVFEDGRAVEVGTHEELMQHKGGVFARMKNLQTLGELRE
jgi:ABC-type multidrug transport system fused ATPase/permease subunit